jgi:hypothetical protein
MDMKKFILKILREEISDRFNKDTYIVKAIKNLFDENNEFESFFTLPFDNEETFSVVINYSIKNVNLWENKGKSYYEGVIYLNINSLIVGNGGVYEKAYGYDDIPEWIWDELNDYILDRINSFIPKFFDIDTGYTIEVDFPREW